jgi:hypothetical protein
MDRYEAIVAIVSIIFGSVTLISVAFAVAYGAGRWRKGGVLPDGSLNRLEQRMERIEQSIDAVAVEVERVSESQRFVTKLLAERSEDARRLT